MWTEHSHAGSWLWFVETMRVALIQLTSQDSLDANLREVENLLAKAHAQKADYALLPENFAFFGSEEEKRTQGEKIATQVRLFLQEAAQRFQMPITGGGFPIKAPSGRFFNSALTFNAQGEEIHRYDKIHLFDATPGAQSYHESLNTEPGTSPLSLFSLSGFSFGMSICYDLRFPYLYQTYAQKGAQVLCVPAAFTQVTGAAHWEILLRARAIENTCYVLAAAQCGEHTKGRETFGHSMAVDPWGKVMAQLEDGPGLCVVSLDAEHLNACRRRMPSLRAIYPLLLPPTLQNRG